MTSHYTWQSSVLPMSLYINKYKPLWVIVSCQWNVLWFNIYGIPLVSGQWLYYSSSYANAASTLDPFNYGSTFIWGYWLSLITVNYYGMPLSQPLWYAIAVVIG